MTTYILLWLILVMLFVFLLGPYIFKILENRLLYKSRVFISTMFCVLFTIGYLVVGWVDSLVIYLARLLS